MLTASTGEATEDSVQVTIDMSAPVDGPRGASARIEDKMDTSMPEVELDDEIGTGWESVVAKGRRGEVRESVVMGILLSSWTERTHIDV